MRDEGCFLIVQLSSLIKFLRELSMQPRELAEKIAAGSPPVVVDVRTGFEFKAGSYSRRDKRPDLEDPVAAGATSI